MVYKPGQVAGEKITLPPDSVVEWFIEDAFRYERLANAIVEYEEREHDRVGDTTKTIVKNAVVSIVLSVPRALMDSVTTELRKSRKASPQAQYLKAAALHADDASAMQRRLVSAELQLKRLKEAYLKQAKATGKLAAAEVYLREALLSSALAELGALYAAISERKVEVAAKLLEQIADRDDDIDIGR